MDSVSAGRRPCRYSSDEDGAGALPGRISPRRPAAPSDPSLQCHLEPDLDPASDIRDLHVDELGAAESKQRLCEMATVFPMELVRPPHGWQVGLDEPGVRICDTLVCPVPRTLRPVLAGLRRSLPEAPLVWVPAHGYAHSTLAMREFATTWEPKSSLPGPLRADVTGLGVTAYSVRLELYAPDVDSLADAFGYALGPLYVTLAYASAPCEIELPPAEDLGAEPITFVTVEHRRFSAGCPPFHPRVLQRWPLHE